MKLNMAEELLLLVLHDRKGTVVCSASLALDYGLRGALLAELVLANRLALDGKKLVVADTSPTGDALLDAALTTLQQAKRPRDTRHWVGSLSFKPGGIRKHLLERLVQKGILRREQRRLLWVFSYQIHPTQDVTPELRVRDMLRADVTSGITPKPRTLTLLGLVSVCDLFNEVFPKEGRSYARRRMRELEKGEALQKPLSDIVAAVKHAKEAAQAAVVVTHGASATFHP
jgi:hypothetical protein